MATKLYYQKCQKFWTLFQDKDEQYPIFKVCLSGREIPPMLSYEINFFKQHLSKLYNPDFKVDKENHNTEGIQIQDSWSLETSKPLVQIFNCPTNQVIKNIPKPIQYSDAIGKPHQSIDRVQLNTSHKTWKVVTFTYNNTWVWGTKEDLP